MSQSDLVNHLYDEISFQHELYFWTAGSLITIIVLVVGFYSYQQWRFSDKGIKHIRNKFKKRFKKEFGIVEMQQMMVNAQKMIERLTRAIAESNQSKNELDKKINENDKIIQEMRKQNLSLGIRNRTTIIRNENDEFTMKYLMDQISELLSQNKCITLDKMEFSYVSVSIADAVSKMSRHNFEKNDYFKELKKSINNIKELINDRKKAYDLKKDEYYNEDIEKYISTFNKVCNTFLNKDIS